ncbi:MAG: STAS domain-containing protein [Lachnospiraceae bacterium]|nr:STAS domain-containing protein [Lachnospiraceae bacterium]
MTIDKIGEAGIYTFALDGKLDTTTAGQLEAVLISAFTDESAMEVTLDFTQLTYLSSAGLQVLLVGQKLANASDAVMTITNVAEDIMEVFEMMGFCDILTII